jgi:polysaccharide export outer membrane protein
VLVVGKTTGEIKDSLASIVKAYMNEPRVDVKLNTFRITMLGEVRSPGTFFLTGDNPTIFDALAAAGDLPISAIKYNVELYRDYNGTRTISKIDLTNTKLLNDPSKFQIKPNDVLYVRTRRGTIFREDFSFFSSIATLALTVVALGFTLTNN